MRHVAALLALLLALLQGPSLGLADTVDVCSLYTSLCQDLMAKLACPLAQQQIASCSTPGDLATFQPSCICGGYDMSGRHMENIFDSQVKASYPSYYVYNTAGNNNSGINACSTYEAACGAFMTKTGCPAPVNTNGCGHGSNAIRTFATRNCSCGAYDMSDRPAELMSDSLVVASGDATKLTHKRADGTVDVCGTFTALCVDFLAKIACPVKDQHLTSCPGGKNEKISLVTFKGTCICGGSKGYVDSNRLPQNICDGLVKPLIPSLYVYNTAGTNTSGVNICNTYEAACTSLMTQIGCPKPVISSGCVGGDISGFGGHKCTCGLYDISDRVAELINDALVTGDIPSLIKSG